MRFVFAVLFSLVVCGGVAWAPPGGGSGANKEEALTTLKDLGALHSGNASIEFMFNVWKIRDNGTREKLSAGTHGFSVSMDDLSGENALSDTNDLITLYTPLDYRTENHKIEVKGVSMEMTLDSYYDVAKPIVETYLAQKHPTQDGFQVAIEVNCALSLFSMPETFNLVSHRLEKLVLWYFVDPLAQKISDTLPNLKRLVLNVPPKDFFRLTPNWRKKSSLPDSCRLAIDYCDQYYCEGEDFPYYPAFCVSKADLAYCDVEPLLAYAGHNYGQKDWLEAKGKGKPLDKPSNVGFYAQGQACPWGELLPTGPLQVRITYPKIIAEPEDNKVSESSDPKSAKCAESGQSAEGDEIISSACLETMPSEMLLMIFEQMNPLDKFNMIKAAPGLCALIVRTMEHDFTLQEAPKWCNQYSLWTFKTANPNTSKPEEFTVKAVLSCWATGVSMEDPAAFFSNYFVAFYGYDPDSDKTIRDDPLWVCGPFGQNGNKFQHGQNEILAGKIACSHLYQALTHAAWKEFQAALAEGTFTVSDHYHFGYRHATSKDLYPAPPPCIHGGMPAQKPDCVGEDLWTLAQADTWLSVRNSKETLKLGVSIQKAMYPNSAHAIHLFVTNSDIYNNTHKQSNFFIFASVLNYSSVDAFCASLEEIAADLFQGYLDFPQKLRLGAASGLNRRLTINNCDALTDTFPPLATSVQTLVFSHLRLPDQWSFRNVHHLHVLNTDRSFDPRAFDCIQGGDQPIKVYLENALSVHPIFSAPKCQVVRLASGALAVAGHNAGWAKNKYLHHLGHNLYYLVPDQLRPEQKALGAQAEIFEGLLTLSGLMLAPSEAGDKVLGAYGPEFDALMTILLEHGQIHFEMKQINYKTPQCKERMEKDCKALAQCPSHKRLCALEDSDSLQWTRLDEAFSKQHDIPYLDLFAGVPFLNFNGPKVQDLPKANARLKIVHQGVAEHIFDMVWRGPGGELLTRFSNLRARVSEMLYSGFCGFAVSQNSNAKTYFHRILIEICRQQETLVVKSTP